MSPSSAPERDVSAVSDEARPSPGRVYDQVCSATESMAEETAEALRDRPWIATAARAGWVAKAVVYGALAWAAVEIATDDPSGVDAEYTGVIAVMADDPVSRIVLGMLTLGLALYVGFRALSVALIDDNDADAWAHRVAYLFSALVYVAVGWAAGLAAVRGIHDDDQSTVERLSRTLLESTWGRWSLAAGGVVALGIAGYFMWKGVTTRFLREVDLTDASQLYVGVVTVTGAIGWLGRAAIVGSVASFVTWAAIDADPADARGLDQSLHRLALTGPGTIFVFTTAVLLFAYTVYCLITAPRRRMAWDDDPEPDERKR